MKNRVVRLRDVASLNISNRRQNEKKIAYLDTGNIIENRVIKIQYFDYLDNIPSRAKRKVKEEDTIFSMVRPNQKHFGYINRSMENLIVSTGFSVVTPNKNKINSRYLFYLLTNNEVINIFQKLAEGCVSTYPTLSLRDLLDFEFKLPSLEEQKRIADILTALDDKIELNNQMNQTLEEIASLLYKRWFVDFEFPDDKGNPYKSSGGEMVDSELGMIPKGWEVKKIFEISNVGIGKTPPRKEQGWFSNSKGVNWFSIKDMGNIKSPYIFHSSERLSKRAIDQFNVKIVPKNTVILSFKLTIGRVAITTMDSVTNEAIAQFQILNENVTTEYMYLYFKNLNFMNFGSTSSIATAINSQIIKSIPVIVPIGTINREFSNILIRYFKMMKENSIESDKLNKIRELLLIELI